MLIRDVYPRSRIRFFSIPDPGSKFFPSRVLDPGSASKNLDILTKKNGFSALRNMIRVFHPGSGSGIWILTFNPSPILILYPRSQIQGSKRHRSPDPGSGLATLEIFALLRLRGYRWLLTFNGRCCLNNSFNGSALRSYYVEKGIFCICYLNIVSLIFTVFKL